MKDKNIGYWMITPAMLVILLLMIYPLLESLYISFTNQHIGSSGMFIGLANYQRLFHMGVFLQALANSGIYVSVSLTLKMLLGLFLALILNSLPKGRGFFRALILLPWVIPASMSVLVWQWMFDPTFSVFNWILTHMGLTSVTWLGSPLWARVSVITVNVWRGVPFFAVAIGAGLVNVPAELYEAASLDGAGKVAKFARITLPLLRPVLSVVLLYSLVMTIGDFTIVHILTRGGPMQSTHLLGTLSYQIGLAGSEIGLGSAISLFILPVLMIASFFALRMVLDHE